LPSSFIFSILLLLHAAFPTGLNELLPRRLMSPSHHWIEEAAGGRQSAKDLRVRCDCPRSVMVDVGDAALRSKQSSSPRLSARRNWTHPRAVPVPQPRAGTQEGSANEDEGSWDEGTLRCHLDQGFSAAPCRAFSSQHLIPFATIDPIFFRQSRGRQQEYLDMLGSFQSMRSLSTRLRR